MNWVDGWFYGMSTYKKKRNALYCITFRQKNNFVWIDADYTDDIALLENTLAQAETLLHSLERAAAGIGLLHFNTYKTEYMCFNQRGDISALNGSSLK